MFDHSTNKYIFLDIDGVMNCHSDIRIKRMEGVQDRLDYHFCETAWENLADLCKKTGAKMHLFFFTAQQLPFPGGQRPLPDCRCGNGFDQSFLFPLLHPLAPHDM